LCYGGREGTFHCGDDHAKLFYDKVLGISGAGKTVIFRAPAFITYNPLLRGNDSIPSLKTTGCLSIADSPGQYSPGPDIVVRIPIKAATLLHLKGQGPARLLHRGATTATRARSRSGESHSS
jgi:hypothetical protein